MRTPLHNAPLLIAHRGAGAGLTNPHSPPENTLAAFKWAYGQGICACECDVQLTRDGAVVVFHDFSAQRTAGADLHIGRLTLDEVRALDAGLWKGEAWAGCTVPTLEELLPIVPTRAHLLIELKPGPQIIPPLAAILSSQNSIVPGLILASFNLDTITEAKKRLPQIPCLWVLDFERSSQTDWVACYRQGGVQGAAIRRPADPEQLLSVVKSAGLDGFDFGLSCPPTVWQRAINEDMIVIFWTVNRLDIAQRLLRSGVAGLTTDHPFALHTLLLAP